MIKGSKIFQKSLFINSIVIGLVFSISGCNDTIDETGDSIEQEQEEPCPVVEINITQTKIQTSVLNPNGELTAGIKSEGVDISDEFGIQWFYEGVLSATGPMAEGLKAGEYQLVASSLRADCEAESVFILEADTTYSIITWEVQPSSSCTSSYKNGILQAAVEAGIDTLSESFLFHWYEDDSTGELVSTDALFTGAGWLQSYFVQVINNSNFIDTTSIETSWQEIPFNLIVYETHPVTNSEIPNGELTAGVVIDSDTIVDGYRFEWYIGESNSPDDYLGSGPVMGGLTPRLHMVIARDTLTRCTRSAMLTPSNQVGRLK